MRNDYTNKLLTIPLEGPEKELLYFGTTLKKSRAILNEGIKAKENEFVALRKTYDEAMNAARRYHSKYPVVIAVMAKKMYEKGCVFARSAKGVYYCDSVPISFIDPISVRYISNPGTVKFCCSYGFDFQKNERDILADRTKKESWLKDTLELCKNDPELRKAVEHSIRESVLYKAKGDKLSKDRNTDGESKALVINQSVLEAARHYKTLFPDKNITIANFVNFNYAYEDIYKPVKESLYYCTTLQPVLDMFCFRNEVGDNDRNVIIYSPGINILKLGEEKPVELSIAERKTVDVITLTAPDRSDIDTFCFSDEANDPDAAAKWEIFKEKLYRKKIYNLFHCAEKHHTDILVVGSMGYGIPLDDFTALVKAHQKELRRLKRKFEVVFAFEEGTDSDIYKSFKEAFDGTAQTLSRFI